jgi:hypothetical protein
MGILLPMMSEAGPASRFREAQKAKPCQLLPDRTEMP